MTTTSVSEAAAGSTFDEEQRIRDWRSRAALREAPGIAAYVRGLAISPGARERGFDVPQAVTPLSTEKVDDIDGMYAQLINWVSFWSDKLRAAPPATTIVAWRNNREVQGFRAGTTPQGAESLVRLQTMWLLNHADQIIRETSAATYQTDVTEMMGVLRGRYPTSPRSEQMVSPRPCPACGRLAVHAEWFSPDNADVEVRCEACGYEVPVRHVRNGGTDEWLPRTQIVADPLLAAEVRRELLARTLLLPSEVAALMGKSTRQVERWIADGLPARPSIASGQKYLRLDDVHEWMLNRPTRRR